MTHPNCRIQEVTSLALFVHLSGLFISVIFKILFPCVYYIKLLVTEGGGGGGLGGGSKYYGHYKMTPPPNCRIQDDTSLALFVHLSGLFILFYFHAFNT